MSESEPAPGAGGGTVGKAAGAAVESRPALMSLLVFNFAAELLVPLPLALPGDGGYVDTVGGGGIIMPLCEPLVGRGGVGSGLVV